MDKEVYDLMTLAIIKLGSKEYNGAAGDEGYELLYFLNALMYPHREDFIETISDYIDFSDSEELWKEAPKMTGLGLSIYEEGIEIGKQVGIQTGIEALIRYNLTEGISKEKIIENLKKFFGLTEEKFEQYYEEIVGGQAEQ